MVGIIAKKFFKWLLNISLDLFWKNLPRASFRTQAEVYGGAFSQK